MMNDPSAAQRSQDHFSPDGEMGEATMDREILKGKTGLITGASSGMGADFARELAARGCNLILVARRADRLQELKEEISARFGVGADYLAMDLAAADAPQRLYDSVKAGGRTVDVLINNAGYAVFGEFQRSEWNRLRSMLELDVVALTHLSRLFAADMASRRFGYLLLVASTGAFQPTPKYAAYAAAKSYVLQFGEALHYELRPFRVGCTVLCPGVTRTDFFEVAGQDMTAYQRRTAMASADVARIGVRAMLAGRSCVVAGRINNLIAWSARLAPRQFLAAMADKLIG
jgi:short-subunit dehydrogenase